MCVRMCVFVCERESCVNICLKIANVPKLSSLHNSFCFSLEVIKILYVFYAHKGLKRILVTCVHNSLCLCVDECCVFALCNIYSSIKQ